MRVLARAVAAVAAFRHRVYFATRASRDVTHMYSVRGCACVQLEATSREETAATAAAAATHVFALGVCV